MFKIKYGKNFHVDDELWRIEKNQHMFPVRTGEYIIQTNKNVLLNLFSCPASLTHLKSPIFVFLVLLFSDQFFSQVSGMKQLR